MLTWSVRAPCLREIKNKTSKILKTLEVFNLGGLNY